MNEPLAHSARDGAPEQSYREHVHNVVNLGKEFGREATAYAPNLREPFMASLEMGLAYHDLAKLDEWVQEDLRGNREKLRLNHVDGGVAHLLKLRHAEAAIAAYSHHIGLPTIPSEKEKNCNGLVGMFRDIEKVMEGTTSKTNERTDQELAKYVALHEEVCGATKIPFEQGWLEKGAPRGLTRRMLLSCLVDADHSDTAQHYGREHPVKAPELRAKERLAGLDAYVTGLSAKAQRAAAIKPTTQSEKGRQELREAVYKACRDEKLPEGHVVSCDSPVGTGKTTAIMAHLLRVAVERKLRRIFVVLPFTNIIDQSVEIYREALTLPGENPAAVVAAHHHRMDYASYTLRHLAARWDAPIIVTTAVGFFETISANQTGNLRKLHEVPGAAIFVDEAHAAMPAALWPQTFQWLTELADNWDCHWVLASGSLTRFWELDDFVPKQKQREIPELIPTGVRSQTHEYERKRVQITRVGAPLSINEIADLVLSKPGPRIIIFNTVQSAAVFANYLSKERGLGAKVEHISTALTPTDRSKTVQRIKERLGTKEKDWCLVATSCVEAGVNFSFCSGFRERWGLVNLLQLLGRTNRSGEYSESEFWDFTHDGQSGLTFHPDAKTAGEVLAEMFTRCEKIGRQPCPDDCTEALRLELRNDRGVGAQRMEEIRLAERREDYPEVAQLCRIITADTRTVIVDKELVRRVESKNVAETPEWREIMQNSVQIWASRLDAGKLPIKPICGGDELYAWLGDYNTFIGYMAGILPLLELNANGFGVL